MAVTIDIIDQDAFTAIVTFLSSILPTNTPIIQGLDNRVPMPVSGFVVMTSAGIDRLVTNIDTYASVAQTKSVFTQTDFRIQLDFYGANSQSWAVQTMALLRDDIGVSAFPATIKPLYCDGLLQLPLINGESQYEQRWKLLAHLQYNPTITTAQQSATAISIGIKPIDQTFHP